MCSQYQEMLLRYFYELPIILLNIEEDEVETNINYGQKPTTVKRKIVSHNMLPETPDVIGD